MEMRRRQRSTVLVPETTQPSAVRWQRSENVWTQEDTRVFNIADGNTEDETSGKDVKQTVQHVWMDIAAGDTDSEPQAETWVRVRVRVRVWVGVRVRVMGVSQPATHWVSSGASHSRMCLKLPRGPNTDVGRCEPTR